MRVQFDNILLIDAWSAGMLPQPFEGEYAQVIVLDQKGAELRQLEQLDGGRYAIHRERMNVLTPFALTPTTAERFVGAFERAYNIDPQDVRKACRLALKSLA